MVVVCNSVCLVFKWLYCWGVVPSLTSLFGEISEDKWLTNEDLKRSFQGSQLIHLKPALTKISWINSNANWGVSWENKAKTCFTGSLVNDLILAQDTYWYWSVRCSHSCKENFTNNCCSSLIWICYITNISFWIIKIPMSSEANISIPASITHIHLRLKTHIKH